VLERNDGRDNRQDRVRLVSRSVRSTVRDDTIGGDDRQPVFHSRCGTVTGHDAPTARDAVSGDAEGGVRDDS
jgi:hypothetical protein